MLRVLAFAMIGFFFSPQLLFGQGDPLPGPIRVRLSVNGPDALRASIRAHVVKELEAVGEMAVTGTDPHWILQIVALELESPSVVEPSVVVSVLVLETFPNAPLQVFLSDKLDVPTLRAIGKLTSGLLRFSRHWVETAPARDLVGLTERVVSRFGSVALQNRQTPGKKTSAEP